MPTLSLSQKARCKWRHGFLWLMPQHWMAVCRSVGVWAAGGDITVIQHEHLWIILHTVMIRTIMITEVFHKDCPGSKWGKIPSSRVLLVAKVEIPVAVAWFLLLWLDSCRCGLAVRWYYLRCRCCFFAGIFHPVFILRVSNHKCHWKLSINLASAQPLLCLYL